jgi:hypothetical protein
MITRRKILDSAVMTTRAESRISHGLLVVRSCLSFIALMWRFFLLSRISHVPIAD